MATQTKNTTAQSEIAIAGNLLPSMPVAGLVDRQYVRVVPDAIDIQNGPAIEVFVNHFWVETTPNTQTPNRIGSQAHGKASSSIPTISDAPMAPSRNAPARRSILTLRLNPSRC